MRSCMHQNNENMQHPYLKDRKLKKLRKWLKYLRPCHTLPDSANGRVTDNKILCPFVSVRMRFLSVPHAVNAFRVR